MKKRMLLSTETLLEIRRTGMMIIILTTCKFIFSMKEVTDHKLVSICLKTPWSVSLVVSDNVEGPVTIQP